MSTSAISSVSIFQELQSFYQTRQADLKQLGSALKSGDLTAAQQAFQALAVLGEGGPFANLEPFGNTNRANAFNAVGEALQAGNLSQAQAAFATLTARRSSEGTQDQAAFVDLSGVQHNIEPFTQNPSALYQQLEAYRHQRRADIAQLGKDLQAGNLTAAQQDFAALIALGQGGPSKNGLVFQNSERNQDLQAIGTALQSGDLAGAQTAFASLESTFGKHSQQAQSAISAYNSGVTEIVINFPTASPASGKTHPTEPPVPQTSPNSAGAERAPELVINFGGSPSTGSPGGTTPPELVINLGHGSNSSGSAEEVQINLEGNGSATIAIGAPQAQNGNAEQVTINLQQQRNFELVVNFFNSNAASQPQASSGNVVSLTA